MSVTIGAGSGSGSGEGRAGSGAGETRVVTGLGSILLDRPLERPHGAGTVVNVYRPPPPARPTTGASGGPPGAAGDRMPPLTTTTAAALATDTSRGLLPSNTTPLPATDPSSSSPGGQGGRRVVGSGTEYEEWADRPGASSATGLLPYAHKQQEVGLESLVQYLLQHLVVAAATLGDVHSPPSFCMPTWPCVVTCVGGGAGGPGASDGLHRPPRPGPGRRARGRRRCSAHQYGSTGTHCPSRGCS